MGRIAAAVVILGCAAIVYGQAAGPAQNAPAFEVASVRVNQSETLGSHLRLSAERRADGCQRAFT